MMNDINTVQKWLTQEAPKPEELTEDDVFFAWLANDLLTMYHQHSKWSKFTLDRCTLLGYRAYDVGWKQAIEDVKRGVAVLNGYILWRNPRTAINNTPANHSESVQDRVFSAGYLATTEQHVIYSLIPADDLLTIGQAAQLVYGETSQSKRVMIKNAMTDGELQIFVDQTENNPQKNLRVSRRECIRLKMRIESN